MMRSRQLAALVVTAVLAQGCAQSSDKAQDADAQNKTELVHSLLDAAAAALAQGDATTAATYYRSVYAHEPNNVVAAVGLMQSLRLAGALDEARVVAAKALATWPKDPVVLAEVGKTRLATGQAADAVNLLQQAAAANPGDWRIRSALGLAYDRLGDYGQADTNYRAALALSSDNAAVLNNFALSRAMAGDIDGARGLAQRAVATGGADLRMRQNLALIYALGGNMAKAEELTKRDLPPALARDTIAYYREAAAPPAPETAMAPAAPTKIALLTDQPAATPAPVPDGAERFTVQLGSYLDEARAHSLAHRVTAGGLPVTVSRDSDREGRTRFVVRSGDFTSPAKAARTLASAKALSGLEPMVVRLHDPASAATRPPSSP